MDHVRSGSRTLQLESIYSTRLDWRHKGVPFAADGMAVREIGRQGFNVLNDDVPFPCATLKLSAVQHNSQWMQRFVEQFGARIAPHGKTTMAPQLFQRQLDDGAWGLTAATLAQVRVYRRFGVRRIVLANQIVSPRDAAWIQAEMDGDPAFEFYCLVDSESSLRVLVDSVRSRVDARPFRVLVEVGVVGGRTGTRTVPQALALCRQVRANPDAVELAGIEAFEGILTPRDPEANSASVRTLMRTIGAVANAALAEHLFAVPEPLLSAGGSALFDTVARELSAVAAGGPFKVLLRSGCYLTHDSHHYETYMIAMRERGFESAELQSGLKPALEVCARIQSIPEPGRAIAGFGKRDASFDIDLPMPLWAHTPGDPAGVRPIDANAVKVVGLNDHHAYLDLLEGHGLQFGDIVGFGISHPCTTFDKWPVVLVVDDQYRVVDAVLTHF